MQVVSGMTGDGDASLLDRMLVLAMATPGANLSPSIILDQSTEVADFDVVPYPIFFARPGPGDVRKSLPANPQSLTPRERTRAPYSAAACRSNGFIFKLRISRCR